MIRKMAVIALSLSLFACAQPRTRPSNMPVFTAPSFPEEQSPRDNPGSLFTQASSEFLFSDSRARRVGDIVMVKIVDTTAAKNKASTTSKKTNDTNLSVGAYLGKSNMKNAPLVGGALDTLGMAGPIGTDPMIKAGVTSNFTGDGETKRESNFTATVGARVVRVLPNSVLQVEGARETRVNEETQIIVVRGMIRLQDIGPDNSISSANLADAQIEYYGQGVLTDKQKPGWLARILDNIWPF